MERILKFRGQDSVTGEWYYGNLTQYQDGSFSIDGVPVETNSVGQFTGFTDCVTREIYENDVLHLEEYGKNCKAVVKWNEEIGAWCMQFSYEPRLGSRPLGEWLKEERFEVIGCIYDSLSLISDKQ